MSEQTSAVVAWLAELSEQARTHGNIEHSDRLLLLAWQAMDGDQITLELLVRAREGLSTGNR